MAAGLPFGSEVWRQEEHSLEAGQSKEAECLAVAFQLAACRVAAFHQAVACRVAACHQAVAAWQVAAYQVPPSDLEVAELARQSEVGGTVLEAVVAVVGLGQAVVGLGQEAVEWRNGELQEYQAVFEVSVLAVEGEELL